MRKVIFSQLKHELKTIVLEKLRAVYFINTDTYNFESIDKYFQFFLHKKTVIVESVETFTEKTNNIIVDIYNKVFEATLTQKIEIELNFNKCTVENLNDDHLTLWVKWGKYDCKFNKLPTTAMATIADNI